MDNNIKTLQIISTHALKVQACVDAYIAHDFTQTSGIDDLLGITSANKTAKRTAYVRLQEVMNSAILLKKLCMGFHDGEMYGQLPVELNKWIKNSLYSRQVCAEFGTLKIWLSKGTIRVPSGDTPGKKYITEEHAHPGSALQAELIAGGYEKALLHAKTPGEVAALVMRRSPLVFITHEMANVIDKAGVGLRSKMPKLWDGTNVLARHNSAKYYIVPILLHKLSAYNVHLLSGHEDVRKAVESYAANNSKLTIDEMVEYLTT